MPKIHQETRILPPGKRNKDKIKTPAITKLSNFGKMNVDREANKEANANTRANVSMEASEQSSNELTGVKGEILTAIKTLKADFSTRLDGFLSAVEETEKELTAYRDLHRLMSTSVKS